MGGIVILTEILKSNQFVLGCIGAMTPEIIRLYKIKTIKPSIDNITYYVLLNIAYIIMGGVVAWLLEASSFYAAFYIGASWDTMISAIGFKPSQITENLGTSNYSITNYREFLGTLFLEKNKE